MLQQSAELIQAYLARGGKITHCKPYNGCWVDYIADREDPLVYIGRQIDLVDNHYNMPARQRGRL